MKPIARKTEILPKSGDQALRAMERHIDDLPLLPQVLVKILQLDPEAENYFDEFEKMAAEDPAFAVRVISLANSASSAPADPIDTIKGALARLGAGSIANFVASLSVQRVFVPREPSQIRLWKHSIETAVGAQRIAQLAPELKVNSDRAYLVGLLHDIGRFVMLEHAEPELREVEEHNWATPDELVQADIDVYTYTHSELGYLACQRWGLPDSVADVVRGHHDDLSDVITAGSLDAEVFCVQIADWLSVVVLDGLDELSEAEVEHRIRHKCLHKESAQSILPVAALCARLRDISVESERLFANLGIG